MTGHISQRAKGSWTIAWSQGVDPGTGKRRRRWATVRGTKREAQSELTRLLAEYDRGVVSGPAKMTVSEWMERWVEDIVRHRNRARTVENYASLIRTHIVPVIGHVRLTKLESTHIDMVLSKMLDSGKSRTTAHHAYVVLSKALKDAIRRGLIHRNPAEAIDPPRPSRYEVNAPEPDAIKRILDAAGSTPHRSLFTLMAFTGMRRGEALALRWANVDLEHGFLSVVETAQRHTGRGIVFEPPKTAAGRRGIALDKQTIKSLGHHRAEQSRHILELGGAYENQDLVFAGPLGLPHDPDAVSHSFARLADRVGLPEVRLHDLRHGHAAGLVRAGVHPRVIQERMGHASAAFTMQVYGHVGPGMQEQAAAAFADLLAAE